MLLPIFRILPLDQFSLAILRQPELTEKILAAEYFSAYPSIFETRIIKESNEVQKNETQITFTQFRIFNLANTRAK